MVIFHSYVKLPEGNPLMFETTKHFRKRSPFRWLWKFFPASSATTKHNIHQHPTGWCPPVISGFINPMNTIVISAINHSEMGLICTNLANELGHHLAAPARFLSPSSHHPPAYLLLSASPLLQNSPGSNGPTWTKVRQIFGRFFGILVARPKKNNI